IQSPFVEDFLKYTATLQQDNTPLLDILWRYYERNKNYIAAARILDQLARKESVELTLSRRLEYISRAVMYAKSCGSVSSVSGEGEFLHELEEKIEVARIQLSILQGIQSLHHSQHTQQAITELNSKLMDVSQLYGDFADPFNLSECKLSIVHCAGHFDVTLIESLWSEIIEQELQSTLGNDRNTRMQSMRDRLLRLGKLYSRNDSYFPTAVRAALLSAGWDPVFIPDIFHQVGVSYSTLFTLYNNLFEEKDTFWGSVGRPLHVLSVLLALLSAYTANSSLVATKHFSVAIDKYLVELQTLDPSTPDINTLTAGLAQERTLEEP
uniref:Nucleoporin Nup133/Nup155-like C-terminal domain-containing protein n=2 Tax=Amphimedon queenslandica TaxID=400682 RepID=A0A1X7TBE2_AMPQE